MMIKKIAINSLIFGGLSSGLLWFIGSVNTAISSFSILVLLLINLLLVALTWKIALFGQSKLLAGIMTLMKVPLIVLLIYALFKLNWLSPMGIVLGVCEFLLIIVSVVILNKKN